MTGNVKKLLIGSAGTLVITILAVVLWQQYGGNKKNEGIASGNGRIEAVEIDIAAKTAGRVMKILANEGDFVTAGQILAKMDTAVLEAQQREAEARLRQAGNAIEITRSQLVTRISEKAVAEAVVVQRKAEVDVAGKRLKRSESLVANHAVSQQQVDDDRAAFLSAQAVFHAAQSQMAATTAAIATARSQVIGAQSDVEAIQATLERIQADLADSVLTTPRDGRVQYRVAQPGEVVAGGGKILNMLDLSDVYMTFFLPTAAAGRLTIGSEVHLVLDAAPNYVIPAQVSFVADVAQFTPKTVETASERQKLMFRVKAQIAPDLLKKHIRKVKTGLPGMAYIQLDPQTEWPDHLQVRLPQ